MHAVKVKMVQNGKSINSVDFRGMAGTELPCPSVIHDIGKLQFLAQHYLSLYFIPPPNIMNHRCL